MEKIPGLRRTSPIRPAPHADQWPAVFEARQNSHSVSALGCQITISASVPIEGVAPAGIGTPDAAVANAGDSAPAWTQLVHATLTPACPAGTV